MQKLTLLLVLLSACGMDIAPAVRPLAIQFEKTSMLVTRLDTCSPPPSATAGYTCAEYAWNFSLANVGSSPIRQLMALKATVNEGVVIAAANNCSGTFEEAHFAGTLAFLPSPDSHLQGVLDSERTAHGANCYFTGHSDGLSGAPPRGGAKVTLTLTGLLENDEPFSSAARIPIN